MAGRPGMWTSTQIITPPQFRQASGNVAGEATISVRQSSITRFYWGALLDSWQSGQKIVTRRASEGRSHVGLLKIAAKILERTHSTARIAFALIPRASGW
ncbi:MAG: hypothetical protein CMJ78_00505 [Planctomycetaceae bacterium]|nr:hypothetical protein [Planctomycetaceae bacterium]